MTRILSFSDIHLDAVTAGRARRAEVLKFLDDVWLLADKHEVDVVIFSGDAHDPGQLADPLYSSDLLRRFLTYPLLKSKPAFVAVAGNHDVIDISEMYLQSPVTTLTPVRIAAQAMQREQAELIHVFDRPLTRLVKPDVAVLGFPYVSRVHAADMPIWDAHAVQIATEYQRKGAKLIVVGHRVVPNAKISSESVEMARGQDQLLPIELIAELKPAIVINGHYHARQVVKFPGFNVHIPGSPVRFTFGEADEVEKGVLLAEI